MTPLLVSVFVASLAGSLHCVGMCGGLTAFAVGAREKSGPGERARALVGYHLTRGAGYAVLGAA
ncbi:MAG: sulfite exporter TauE/SafE family protein, partial [Deltaproteobacteria bacterium]|nr:sulfite exporter TauE/SafE family protein [Deltaproteobacteria bacterium]